MRRSLIGVGVVLTVLAVSACALISATGEYYVTNDSSEDIQVEWTSIHQTPSSGAIVIGAGESARLTMQRLLEADEVPPSHCFTSISIAFLNGATWIDAYEQNPIVDEEWVQVSTGFRRHSYTLTITDGDL